MKRLIHPRLSMSLSTFFARSVSSLRVAGLGAVVALLAVSPVSAQEEGGNQGGGEGGNQGGEEAAAATDVEGKDDKYLAVIGAEIHTGTGEVLRGATMIVRNGKIQRIGYDLFLPEKAKVVHAHGFRVYPGMIALSASARITDGALGFEAEDAGDAAAGADDVSDWVEDWESDWETGAAFDETATRSSDSYDPFGPHLVLTLAAGITGVEQGNTSYRLRRNKIEDVVLAENAMVSFAWGSPDARRATTREFEKAAEYLRQYRAWEAAGDKNAKEPSRRGINVGAIRTLRGDVRAKFAADTANDLLGIARLAQQFGFRPVIDGCREGWVVAGELGRAGATAIVQPRERRAKDEMLVAPAGSSIENAAILHRSGVQVAVKPMSGNVDLSGIAGRDILALALDAGFAVRGGLDDTAALQSVTIVPARILGVDHRVGTLVPGKDADFVITDGDLLHYETHVQLAFVLGEVAYDKHEELFYAHIRPRPRIRITDGLTGPETQAKEPAKDEANGKNGNGKEEKAEEKKGEDKPEEKPDDKPEDKPEDKPADGAS